jgi:hypothetical protein
MAFGYDAAMRFFAWLLLMLSTIASIAACSSSSSAPSCTGANADAGNSSDCPAHYDNQLNAKSCPRTGLVCQYPGAGDQGSDGCNATAQLSCVAVDGGAATWRAAQ